MRRALVLCTLIGCGGGTVALAVDERGPDVAPRLDAAVDVTEIGDATSDAPSPEDAGFHCEPDAQPTERWFDELDAGRPPRGFALSSDERMIVFTSEASVDGGAEIRLWYSLRTTSTATFTPPAPLPLADPGEQSTDPWIVDDGRQLVWTRGVVGSSEARLSTRGADGTYDAGWRITIGGSVAGRLTSPVLTPKALYWLDEGAPRTVQRAERITDVEYGPAVRQTLPPGDVRELTDSIAVSADERAMYVATVLYPPGVDSMAMSHRASASSAWGPLDWWPYGSHSFYLHPRWVSPDDCRVYVSASKMGVLTRR